MSMRERSSGGYGARSGGSSRGDSGSRRPRPNGRSSGVRRRKKVCPFCHERVMGKLDYKSGDKLKKFLTDRGKIVPRRIAGTCAKHQRALSTAIKRARNLAILPFTATMI